MIPLSDPDLAHYRARPVVTTTLIALNVLVFLYMVGLNSVDQFVFTYRYGVIPAELTGGLDLGPVLLGSQRIPVDLSSSVPTWATMFTSMFLHGGWMHLGGNMLFLWVFGDNVEHRFGHVRYLLVYLGTGLAAVWAQVLINTGSEVPMIGASGAIAGVLGAYLLLFPYSRVNTLLLLGFFIMFRRLPAVFLLGFWMLLQAFSGVGSLGVSTGGGVAYFAHIGGFAAGLAVVATTRLFRGERIWQPRRFW